MERHLNAKIPSQSTLSLFLITLGRKATRMLLLCELR